MYLVKSCLRMNFSLTTFYQMVTHLYNSYGNRQPFYIHEVKLCIPEISFCYKGKQG